MSWIEITLSALAFIAALITTLVYDRGNRDHGGLRERVASLEHRIAAVEEAAQAAQPRSRRRGT